MNSYTRKQYAKTLKASIRSADRHGDVETAKRLALDFAGTSTNAELRRAPKYIIDRLPDYLKP